MKKNILLLLLLVIIFSSCSKISGRYSHISIGYLGMNNSVSTYEFDSFGTVKYSLSTSGKLPQDSYNKSSGKYSVEGIEDSNNYVENSIS